MRVCARVLAAALMTGAIAAALSFPALVGQGPGRQRVLAAPPSAHERTLRLPALAAPANHQLTVHRRSVSHQVGPALIDVRIRPQTRTGTVVFHRASIARHTRPAVTPPAVSPPAPAPAPSAPVAAAAPPTRELAAEPQPAPAV